MTGTAPAEDVVHGSCVAWQGQGALILGPSGGGKSALALQLMAFGAGLVADDRTLLRREGERILAMAPATLPAMIEARGLGLLAVDRVTSPVVLRLVVDLARLDTDRLPPLRHIEVLGLRLDLVLRCEGSHFPAAVLQYLKAGRAA